MPDHSCCGYHGYERAELGDGMEEIRDRLQMLNTVLTKLDHIGTTKDTIGIVVILKELITILIRSDEREIKKWIL